MKHLFKIRFDRDAVDTLSLHVSITDDELTQAVAEIWGQGTFCTYDDMAYQRAKEIALDRAVIELKELLREMLVVVPVDGRCL